MFALSFCSLPTDVMNIIFTVGAKTASDWDFLLGVYSSLASEPEKLKILEALASTEDVRRLIWYELLSFIHVPSENPKNHLCH